jgi:cytochrome c peroxidase
MFGSQEVPVFRIPVSFSSSTALVACVSVLALSACGGAPEPAPVPEAEPAPAVSGPPAGFDAVAVPADNPASPEKTALGHQLFFDTRLSADNSRSCYSCHLNENGLTDGRPMAVGAMERQLTRSSPTLWNVPYHEQFYWDGRSGSLEAQAMAAWTGGNMGADAATVVATLNGIEGYRSQFQAVFGADATPETVVQAIAAYERDALVSASSAYDRWRTGDEAAVSDAAKRGAELFTGSAGCATCHAGVLFTDLKYHNVGIGMEAAEPDPGRVKVTGVESDTGAFKTPTLRDISRSAPYFHNGSVATLEEAVDFMLGGGYDNPQLDRENLKKVELSAEQRSDLLAFLRTLEMEDRLEAPSLP